MFNWTFNQVSGLNPRPSSAPAMSAPPQPAVTSAPEQNPQLAARRAQALRGLFPKLSSWFANRRDSLCITEVNEYLAQASNVVDLEQRIRVIERQRHFS